MLAPILPKPIMPSCMWADCTRGSEHHGAPDARKNRGGPGYDDCRTNFATARREQGRMTTSGVHGHDVVGAVVAVAAERLGAAEASTLAPFFRHYYARVAPEDLECRAS